jgi:hypothetical protein
MNWEGLEVSVRHPVGNNLFLTAAYTWSHGLSDDRATEMFQGSANPVQDIYHPQNEYGTSTVDLTHVLSCSYIWSLPGYHLRRWKGAALGGWKYSGIMTIESGFPVDPALSVASPGLALRPDLVGSVKGPKTVNEWFNTNAFVQAPPGYFGNAGNGTIRGPGLVNFDMAFYKDFHIRERHMVEFRAELFNIFNHANFNGIDPALGSGTFGQVISAADPRIAEFALRYEF